MLLERVAGRKRSSRTESSMLRIFHKRAKTFRKPPRTPSTRKHR
jgi:hypothetical protein